MAKRALRKASGLLAAIGILLAMLVAAVLWTPLGVRAAVALGWPIASGDSGLRLSVGTTGGSLARGITLENVTLTDEEGVLLLKAGTITGRPASLGVRSKRLDIAGLRLEGCELLFETDEGGGLVGWSLLSSAKTPEDSAREPRWNITLDAELVDVTVTVRNTATGLNLVAGPVNGTVGGTVPGADIDLSGPIALSVPSFGGPLTGDFEVLAALSPDLALELHPLTLRTNAGNLRANGLVDLSVPAATGDGPAVKGPSAELSILSSHELSELIALFTGPQEGGLPAGTLTLDTELSGPLAAPSYEAELRAEGVEQASVRMDLVTATISGDVRGLTAESLHIEAAGGALDAIGSMEFPERGDAARGARLTWDGTFSGIDLERLAEAAPGLKTEVVGRLDGSLTTDWTLPGIKGLTAGFEVGTSRLSAAGKDLGALSGGGSLNGGLLTADLSCCRTRVHGLATLGDSGLKQADITLRADDLSELAAALGVPDLEGSGTAAVLVEREGASPALKGNASFEDLRFRGVQVAPVAIDATTYDGDYRALFHCFDSSVTGTATLTPEGDYSVSIAALDFDLAPVIPDSIREAMSLAGVTSFNMNLRGAPGGRFIAEGEVAELDLAVRRQSVAATSPFSFSASPDSVWISGAEFAGTFGQASLAGSYTASQALDAVATFSGVDLFEICGLLPTVPEVRPSGQLEGAVRLQGNRRAPAFSAQMGLRAFEMAGLELESLTLEAEGDSSDVFFDLLARSSESGEIWLGGAAPVVTDTATVLRFDPRREFGISVSATEFILDAGEAFLPSARGEKLFRFDGSALLTGTADSLTSVNGGGLLSDLTATMPLAEFALADTVYFEVRNGLLEFERLLVDVTRRNVLGDPAGGRMTVAGSVAADGAVDLTAETDGLDIGHLARALGINIGPGLKGRLDAMARVEGSSSDPSASLSWNIDAPTVFDVGFERGDGSATYESGLLSIERAELVAGASTIGVSGQVRTGRAIGTASGGGAGGEDGVESGSPEFDLRLTAVDFRLGRLKDLPPGLDRLSGRVDADMGLRGRADSPTVDGTLTVTDGRAEGFGLMQPIRDIGVEVEGGGSSIAVNQLRASSGDGAIEASALFEVSQGFSAATFLAVVDLKSPEFEIEDLALGRASGILSWGGTPAHSTLSGNIVVDRTTVTRSVGIGDLIGRAPRVVVIRRANDTRANVDLDLDIDIGDRVAVESNVAQFSLSGGAAVRGTLLAPRVSGSIQADEGTLTYLKNEFALQTLTVRFMGRERRDPHVHLVGTADVESRSDESYTVTASMNGYLSESGLTLSSEPALSQPDIASLLTFGNTFGGLVAGDQGSGSSGDAFSSLARGAFLSSAFGFAERSLEQLLNLDEVAIDEEQILNGDGDVADTDVTLGKDFGGRLRVNYTTAVGRFSNQRVEVSFELARRLWLETRTNPEGNHAIGLKLQIPFK